MKRSLPLFMILFSILTLISVKQLSGQSYLPFTQSNYSGISGVLLQPASIADSRYSFDMTLFGFETEVSNTFVTLKRDALFKSSLWNEEDFADKYVTRQYNGKDKSGFITAGIVFPSFMVNVSKNTAFGLTTRTRFLYNLDNITEDLAHLISERFDYEPLLHTTLTNSNVSMQMNAWLESGLTLATVLVNRQKHFLKAGATVKYLQGMASAYGFIEDLTYRLDSPDTLSLFQSTVNYGLAGTFDNEGIPTLENLPGPGVGFDVGIVYEYRPHIDRFIYSMDGRDDLLRNDKDKYLFRLGVSLLDFGSIKYQKGYYSQDFVADIRDWYIKGMEFNSLVDINDTLKSVFGFKDHTNESFRMGLPTALSVQFDYNVGGGFYVNFTPFFALRKGNEMISKNHYLTSYTITPRYDHKWFGLAVPVHVDQYNRFNTGLAMRLGPVWIGSNTLITNNLAKESYGVDAYFMLKIPVFKRLPRDKDKDGVSNKLDMCPDLPGPWETKGCPDSDGDGIPDHLDECPDKAGLPELKGCPDRDNDGIPDHLDECPDVAGLPEFNGCPDSDGDGIPDHLDKCPQQYGLSEFDGCPDSDGDGIPDHLDECPDKAGLPQFNGCPDTDGDGIPDHLDACPDEAGPAKFKGCPDRDGDGIPDKYDLCPDVPGIPENNGCPPIEKKEKEIIDRAFSNLEFETGRAIIKSVSYPSLNELAQLLVQKTAWKVLLSGHTDNTGTPEKNIELSRNRAQAVKDYLIKQGVAEYRIRTEWFGQEKPIDDNKSAAGRQRNRRVEMKIVFD